MSLLANRTLPTPGKVPTVKLSPSVMITLLMCLCLCVAHCVTLSPSVCRSDSDSQNCRKQGKKEASHTPGHN